MENEETIISQNFDILDVAKTIAKEKGITSEEVLEAMEMAIAKAGRTKYGYELDIRANVNRDKDKGEQLNDLGWKVLTLWECKIKKDLDRQILNVKELIN